MSAVLAGRNYLVTKMGRDNKYHTKQYTHTYSLRRTHNSWRLVFAARRPPTDTICASVERANCDLMTLHMCLYQIISYHHQHCCLDTLRSYTSSIFFARLLSFRLLLHIVVVLNVLVFTMKYSYSSRRMVEPDFDVSWTSKIKPKSSIKPSLTSAWC
jgi:hypothetical protein